MTISHAKFHGKTWKAPPAEKPRFSLAKLNHQSAQVNTVTTAALNHIVDDPANLPAHQDVELGWRLGRNSTLFTTLHRVVPGPIDSSGHGVSFTGDLDWTRPISDLVSRFNQFADQQEASVPRSFYQPNYVEPPSLRERVITTTQGFLSGAAVGRATTTSERRRLQASQRLVAARQQYAHDEYLETGNTREILRAMQQSQAVAASALEHLAQHQGADKWWDV